MLLPKRWEPLPFKRTKLFIGISHHKNILFKKKPILADFVSFFFLPKVQQRQLCTKNSGETHFFTYKTVGHTTLHWMSWYLPSVGHTRRNYKYCSVLSQIFSLLFWRIFSLLFWRIFTLFGGIFRRVLVYRDLGVGSEQDTPGLLDEGHDLAIV